MSYYRKNSVSIMIIFFLLIVVGYIVLLPFQITLIDQFNSEEIIDNLYGHYSFQQTFSLKFPIDILQIKFATFMRQNTGQLQMTIWQIDQQSHQFNRKQLLKFEIPMSQIKDNQYYSIRLPYSLTIPTGMYALEFQAPDGSPDNCVSPWFCLFDSMDRGRIVLNGKPIFGDMTYKINSLTTARSVLSAFLKDIHHSYLSGLRRIIIVLLIGFTVFSVFSVYYILKIEES